MNKINYKSEVIGVHHDQVDVDTWVYIGNQPIGLVQYTLYNNKLYINDIFVRPEYRRQGWASRLIKYIQKENPEYKYESSLKTDLGAKFKHKDVTLEEEYRAKPVFSKCYVFDFDDTLVQTDAKIHIIRGGRRIKSLTPEEFNKYTLKPDEVVDAEDFADPRFIINATKYKMWPILNAINMKNKMGKDIIYIYILTARDSRAKLPIHNFLIKKGIDIPLENIITVGPINQEKREKINTAQRKAKVLIELSDKYDEIFFFDDCQKNIDAARKIPKIKTQLIDKYNIK